MEIPVLYRSLTLGRKTETGPTKDNLSFFFVTTDYNTSLLYGIPSKQMYLGPRSAQYWQTDTQTTFHLGPDAYHIVFIWDSPDYFDMVRST